MTTLLPPNATRFEREIERALHRVGSIDVDALRRMRDPYQCSTAHLPFLAYGRGVDLWYDDWPEWKKRRITAEIYGMKGLKGTLPGIQKYLSYVDARVVENYLPPHGVVLRPQNSDALKAWRERFAEIRLYPFQVRGERSGLVVTGQASPAAAVVGRATVRPNRAHIYYGRRATLVDNGVETELRSIDQIEVDGSDLAEPYATFAISTRYRASDATIGRTAIGRMTMAAKTRGRLIVINPTGVVGGAAVPEGFEGVTPLHVAPERIYQQHPGLAREAVVGAAVVGRAILRVGQAARYIYDSWRLLDDSRTAGSTYRAVGPVIGKMVPGLTKFTALLRVDASYRRPGRAPVIGRATIGRFVLAAPSDRLDRIGAAIYRARAVRDQINFTTRTHRPRALADLSFAHSVPWGGLVPINRSPL